MTGYKAAEAVIETLRMALDRRDRLLVGKIVAGEIDSGGATRTNLSDLAKQVGCSLRTLQYYVGVYRLADRAGLSQRDINSVGWTRLAMLASAAEKDAKRDDIIAMCRDRAGRERTVTELRAMRAGIPGTVKTITFTLNGSQRRELEAALLRHGAVKSGRRILHKDRALMKIISK